jgi:hypothetical protein
VARKSISKSKKLTFFSYTRLIYSKCKWVHKLFTPVLCEVLFLLGLWRPLAESHARVATEFAQLNRTFWGDDIKGSQNILVEGHLSEYGPNYLFRTGLAAKALQAAGVRGQITIVTNGFSFQWEVARMVYESFGIKKWVFLGRKFVLLSPLIAFIAAIHAFPILRMRNPQRILEIHHGGIKAGDLIYDEILRKTKKPTIKYIGWDVFIVVVRSWYYYYQYQLLFTLKHFDYYVATHTAYPEYGLLCRVALKHDAVVIETTDIQMSCYEKIEKKILPTYHQGINAEICKVFYDDKKNIADLELSASESLRRRLQSEISQIDAKKAYSGKSYTKMMLAEYLGIENIGHVGFIAAHIFCDSPHLSSSMLHSDYYLWLVETIDSCALARDVDWIVKPHPACDLYGERGMVESLVQSKGASNIHICPPDLNTCSLRDCADIILTVHGTVGLEFSCLGIPTILAGTPFYAGFGFSYDPNRIDDYRELIAKASSLPRLSDLQVSFALQVFAIWEQQFDWDNPIVNLDLLALVWGNGVTRDLTKAYEMLTKNLSMHNPRNLKLWRYVNLLADKKLSLYLDNA